jgi:hypothetical protein
LKIYIRSDGSIEPSDAPLSRVGNTYYVTADINITSDKGIVIERDNITLDGGHHSINIISPFLDHLLTEYI